LTDTSDRAIFVAEESDKPVGVAEAYPISNDAWLVDSIAVLHNYRRRGIARRLMVEMMSHIRKRGGKQIRLYVHPDNSPAIRFFAKLGFTIAVQHICMTMKLRP